MSTDANLMYEWKDQTIGLLSSSESEFTKPLSSRGMELQQFTGGFF